MMTTDQIAAFCLALPGTREDQHEQSADPHR